MADDRTDDLDVEEMLEATYNKPQPIIRNEPVVVSPKKQNSLYCMCTMAINAVNHFAIHLLLIRHTPLININ